MVVMSRESNAWSLFVSQECLHPSFVCVGPRQYNLLNTKDADMDKALLSLDITTKVLIK